MASQLEGREVRHRTDNQSAERIMTVGSRNPDLHKEAILLYKICRKHNIRLSVEWVSRNQNETADALSRCDDPDDYKLDPSVFRAIDQLWGPHTYDRFASMITTQLPRFSSKYMNPKCDSTDAFTVCWLGENNWLLPPPYLIPRVIRHMSANKEYGTLLIPYWPSAPWWPLLITKQGTWNWLVTDCLDISPYNGIFITGHYQVTYSQLVCPLLSCGHCVYSLVDMWWEVVWKLANLLPSIIVRDRAPSTICTYFSAYRLWKRWASTHSLCPIPADGTALALYIVSLIQQQRSVSAVNSAIYGIDWVHKKNGFGLPSEHSVVKQVTTEPQQGKTH